MVVQYNTIQLYCLCVEKFAFWWGEEGDYIPIATLSPPRMTPALRWVVVRTF